MMHNNLEECVSRRNNEDGSNDEIDDGAKITHSFINLLAKKIQLDERACEVLSISSTKILLNMVQCAKEYMLHHYHQKLFFSDFKKALKYCIAENIYLESSYNDTSNDIVDLKKYFCENKVWEESSCIDLYGSYSPYGSENPDILNISQNLQNYFDFITDVLLDDKSYLLEHVFLDLKRNCNILPLVPYFLNFILTGFTELNHNIYMLKRLLHTIWCLLANPTLYFGHQICLNNLRCSLLKCILDPATALANPGWEHWILRVNAANLLIEILKKYPNESKVICRNTFAELIEILKDWEKPLCSHYGAIVTLIAMGIPKNEVIILFLIDYLNHLEHWEQKEEQELDVQKKDESQKLNVECIQNINEKDIYQQYLMKQDMCMIYDKLLLACELLIRHYLKFAFQKQNRDKNFFDNFHDVEEDSTLPLILHIDFVEYFGDALAIRLPLVDVTHIVNSDSMDFTFDVEEKFSDSEDENLLEQFETDNNYEQVSDLNYSNRHYLSHINHSTSKNFKIKEFYCYPSVGIKILVIEKQKVQKVHSEEPVFEDFQVIKKSNTKVSCLKNPAIHPTFGNKCIVSERQKNQETDYEEPAFQGSSVIQKSISNVSNLNKIFNITIKNIIPHKRKASNEVCGNMMNIF